MRLVVTPETKTMGRLVWPGGAVRCALGKGGVVPAAQKREGDGATPAGVWPLREVFYRADRLALPPLRLEARALSAADGWCDAPDDRHYNRFVSHPYPASAEHLWRDDALYDVIAVLGYNDDPVTPGKGSAIFFHLAADDYAPTAGCVAVARDDMLAILPQCGPDSVMDIRLP
jgi:L,D-peptidoglycan transpeptidase YkuD (ErfK/YbiS/YcfS/YnhG family)